MDVFSRTFLPAAVDAGVAVPTLSRHMPVFRRCVGPADTSLLVSRCALPARSGSADHLLLLTARRLVVTHQTRLTHRLRLHLNTELRQLSDITWNPDPRLSTIELAATAVDGVRERFLIRTRTPEQVWRMDGLFARAFRAEPVLGAARGTANRRSRTAHPGGAAARRPAADRPGTYRPALG
ncbi:hypothetical protein [Melissospora conviva]|uniref:hypothetical protein n=1 Tax=Melissospora conviva TaxID=3388432 RepID=UPI003C218AF7